MSLDFLTIDAGGPVARSPMLAAAVAAGARVEPRGGWSIVTDFGSPERERECARGSVVVADLSHLGKLDVQGPAAELARVAGELTPGRATTVNGACWCPLTAERALVIGHAGPLRRPLAGLAVDVTTALAALRVVGPLAREAIARFCALDLRDGTTPVYAFRPGSIARTPGYVLRRDADDFLLLFGWALGEYMWSVVADAVAQLGGRAAGVDVVHEDEPAHA